MKNIIHRLKYFLKILKHKGGLLPLRQDLRDLHLNVFGITDYQPLAPEVDIKTLSVKDQSHFNTCTFNAGTVQKELDENVILSVRFASTMANKMGLVSGEGLADLRAVQKVIQQFGICEESLLANNTNLNWTDYTNQMLLSSSIMANAASHKSKSFWAIGNTSQILQLLDQGRTVTIGLDWKAAWNMIGGFSLPWIISMLGSFVVGGHSTLIRGYKKNYNGVPLVFKVQNSYSAEYGDGGCFYMKPEDLQPFLNKYGAYAQMDIQVDIGKFIMTYSGKVVKTGDNPNCYLIQNGKKCLFPDLPTLWDFGFTAQDILIVDSQTLNAVPLGDPMKFGQGHNTAPIKGFAQTIASKSGDERNAIFEQLKIYFADLFK